MWQVQEQGYYQLKPELWKKFDPFFAKTWYNGVNGVALQACHQLLWNVLNHVNILVKDEKAAATGKSLSITALQMMEIALYVFLF